MHSFVQHGDCQDICIEAASRSCTLTSQVTASIVAPSGLAWIHNPLSFPRPRPHPTTTRAHPISIPLDMPSSSDVAKRSSGDQITAPTRRLFHPISLQPRFDPPSLPPRHQDENNAVCQADNQFSAPVCPMLCLGVMILWFGSLGMPNVQLTYR